MKRTIVRRAPQAGASGPWGADLPPVLRRVYAARGVVSDGDLELSLEGLIPVGTLPGLGPAVDLLLHVRRTGGRVVVVGDFDADGATSTALVVRHLRQLGFAGVDFVVPNRFDFGYGLSPELVDCIAPVRPALILTVDNGISSASGVAAARALGIDVLVTDHHLPPPSLPDAAAIVNPNLTDSTFSSRSLAGVGVAFYLMAALSREAERQGSYPEGARSAAALLDLVALGTVADLVALDRNNRILVHQGLKRIRAGRCTPGVRALLEAAGRRIESAVAADLGFHAGPRLNAAGRLDDMSVGIRCLLTDDLLEARHLAGDLSQLNRDRRELEAKMQQEALAALTRIDAQHGTLPLGLTLHEPGWHQGVVGLVASRVKDRVHRPVVAFAAAEDGLLKGSARSVSGVHVRDVLEAIAARHPDMIVKFGGHAMAAGLTLRAASYHDFADAFAREVGHWLSEDDARGVVHSDGELTAGELTLETAALLREAGPWGQAFPEPVFDGRFEVVSSRVLAGRHLKLMLRPPVAGPVCEAIAFRHFDSAGAVSYDPGDAVTAAFRLDVNEFGGSPRLQLLLEHLTSDASSGC